MEQASNSDPLSGAVDEDQPFLGRGLPLPEEEEQTPGIDAGYLNRDGRDKEQSAGSDVGEMREIERDGELGGDENGKGKQDTASAEILGAASKNGKDLETDGRKNEKKKKRSRRKGKTEQKACEGNGDSSYLKGSAGNPTGCKRTEKGTNLVYSREEMEALRYFNVKGQRKFWQEIYNAFSPSVRAEYDELRPFGHRNKQSGFSSEPQRASGSLGVKDAVIEISKEDVEEACRYWEHTLVGAVMGDRIPISVMENFVKARWNGVTLPTIYLNKAGNFLFRFDTQTDKEHILQSGPWMVGGQKPLILKQWLPVPDMRSDLSWLSLDGDLEIMSSVELTCDDSYNGEDDNYVCDEYDEDEDSDDGYSSIQRPALLVEGEPDFDSGPPEDGLEYLRRVRWEAAQIPNVKVAKLDKSKLNKEQSVYMPEIPDIERCPQHMLPLKQWEEEFLSDFSELRLALSHLDGSRNAGPLMVQSTSTPVFSQVLSHLTGSRNAGPVKDQSNSEPVRMAEPDGHSSPEFKRPAGPTLPAILKMDLVTRVNSLKRRISLFVAKDELSRNECLWLFALCAAIDTPLDADTSAALRGLLRKCSKLRAGKSELDDEAVMLNIMVTISGKYFGQCENW